jgi:hypothetical protein
MTKGSSFVRIPLICVYDGPVQGSIPAMPSFVLAIAVNGPIADGTSVVQRVLVRPAAIRDVMMVWWLILYWPIMGLLIFASHRAARRHRDDPAKLHRAELALGCGIIALPAAPLMMGAVGLILHLLGK